ncbi:MAG: phosphoribosyltransferase [Chloroflexi bacterium]|nr:phosphoribosyltransferase [Chloroflexota bacterium]
MSTFQDRTEAGQQLVGKLMKFKDRTDAIVLALPRGGVPVAYEVAKALHLPLDVFVVRKLGTPGYEEMAMGAIASGGVRVLNTYVINQLNVTDEAIDRITEKERKELQRREVKYRGNRPFPQLEGKIVILIDDGLATGATMAAAVHAVREYDPAYVVVAVPVASPETCAEFADFVDEVVCVLTPPSFRSVGGWYREFPQTSDEEVQRYLERTRLMSDWKLTE